MSAIKIQLLQYSCMVASLALRSILFFAIFVQLWLHFASRTTISSLMLKERLKFFEAKLIYVLFRRISERERSPKFDTRGQNAANFSEFHEISGKRELHGVH